MQFSEIHKSAILSDFPVTLAIARLFEKSDNLTNLCCPEILHSYKILEQNGNRKTFKDHNNNLTNYAYDGLNRLDSLSFAGLGTFNWSYNPAGLTENIDYPNGASVEYTYDDANRIESVINKKSGAEISSHLYQYDANGNRTQLTESNIHLNQIITYGYDKADRLTSVEYPNNEKTEYILDKVGNRTQEIITGAAPNTKTYSYNIRDQLTQITDTLGSNINYTFDDAGNQLTKDQDGTLTSFEYTARGRVKAITVGAGNPINYQYDYTGQRVNYQTNGTEKRYIYDGLTLIAETNTIGNTIARFHYGDRYQLAEQRNTFNSYYHVDSLGTNVAVTNQDGSIAARYEYDAYGNLLTQAGSSETPFGFTGYQKDEDTGLYYANARYYDSSNGRFLREDPFDGDLQTPPSLHRYIYANVNPTVYTDPSGNCSITHSLTCQLSIMRNENNAADIDRLIQVDRRLKKERAADGGVVPFIAGGAVFLGEGAVEGSLFVADFIGNALGFDSFERRFSDRVGHTVDFFANEPLKTSRLLLTDELIFIDQLDKAGKKDQADFRRGKLVTGFASTVFGGLGLTKNLTKLPKPKPRASTMRAPDIDARIVSGTIDKSKALVVVESPQNSIGLFDYTKTTAQLKAKGVPTVRSNNQLLIGESGFNVGERIIQKASFDRFIKNQDTFMLGSPDANAFFFNKPGANSGSNSLDATIVAGFTKEDISGIINNGGNEVVRLRFKLDKIEQIVIPGISKISNGIGNGHIPGINELFTGNGRTKTYLNEIGIEEFIGTNVKLTQDDIISVTNLGKIEK